jgi:Basic region leucine zipper
MVSSSLQGLNVVHPAQPHSSVSDSQDLLSAPPYPDLTAQLDLWTNLSFESDEPLIHNDDEKYLNRKKLPSKIDDDEEEDLNPTEGAAAHDGHENVVTGTMVNNDGSANMHVPHAPNFDLNQFLAGIGIDPFSVPNSEPSLPPGVPSLAQLLSLHSQQTGSTFSPPPPITIPPPSIQQDVPSLPPAKRVRTRKVSVSTEGPETPYSPSFSDSDPNTTTPVTPAEDKRRRNTAASARFRMKKKEREAALEKKAKELEVRVNELERECEGLRRENGWLKGLVVGVTGAQPTSAGKKRSRDESEAGSVSVGAR